MCNVRDMGKDTRLIFYMRADLGDLWCYLIDWHLGLSRGFAAVCLTAGNPVWPGTPIPHSCIALVLIIVQFMSSNPHHKLYMTANVSLFRVKK